MTTNIFKIFRALLIALVIGGLSYLTFLIANSYGGQFATKALVIFGSLGLLFFIATIALVRITKDES
jgi:hypothetical protein